MKPRQIFNNSHYNACVFYRGEELLLAVSCNRRQFGYYLEGEKAIEWADAIEHETDRDIQHALCGAIINS